MAKTSVEENKDLFGTPKKLLEDRINELQDQLKKEKAKTKMFAKLYNAVNYMQGELGAEGEINTESKNVERVMDVLFDIDGGVFKEMKE